MKRKICLTLSLVALLMCMLVLTAGAVSTTGNIDYEETATLKDGTVVPIYDENKNPLLWYISGTEIVTVDGVETTKNVYSSVVSTATKENPDANGYYVSYNGTTKTFTGPTGEQLEYHYSHSIYVKHVTDTSVNFMGRDTMVVANLRGVEIGDFQGGTINVLQYFYAPANMVRSGDFRASADLILTDFTQSVNMREVINQAYKSKNVEIRFPVIEPIYDENGVLVNAFSVASYAFQGTPITSFDFPETLYYVGNNAFQNAQKMTTLGKVPNLTVICNDAFENCYVLTGLDFKSTTVKSIGARSFKNAGLQEIIEFPETLISIDTNAFRGVKLTRAIILPKNLETLGTEVFRDSKTLEYFDFNDCKVQGSIGDYMFYSDSNLRAVVFSDGITNFGTENNSGIFSGCSSLEVVYLPINLVNVSTFKNKPNLYFVSEKFKLDWYDGMFEDESWGGQKPEKPAVYYMPSGIVSFGELFNSCHGLNDLIVFPEGVTAIENKLTFYNLNGKCFAFLGEVTTFVQESNKTANYYFLNDAVTEETLTITGNQKGNFYYHSKGVHLEKSVDIVSFADCVNNEKSASICFCGISFDLSDKEGTALGHNHITYVGMAYDNYFESGYYGYKCERCDDIDKSEKTDALFAWLGYSYTEAPIGGVFSVTQGFRVNKSALEVYRAEKGDAFSFGVLATGNAGGGEIKPTLDGEKVLSHSLDNSPYDCFEIKVIGITESLLNAKIVFCGYALEGDNLFYLDGGETKTELSGCSYNELGGFVD